MADEKVKNALWDAYDPDAGRDCLEFSFDKPKPEPVSAIAVVSPSNCILQYSNQLAAYQQGNASPLSNLANFRNPFTQGLSGLLGGMGAGLSGFNHYK